jgi:cytosine/adenosine deaminase-related metal-dependent hydrolase
VLIHHAMLIAPGSAAEVMPDGALLIQKGLIVAIGSSTDLLERYPAEERLDAGGMWLLPGFICAHARMTRSLARGMALPGPDYVASGSKMDEFWQHYAGALDYEAIRYGTLLACLEAIRFGTTLVFDQLSSPNAIRFALDAVAEAVLQCGLRAQLSLAVSDLDNIAVGRAAVDETVRFAGRVGAAPLLSAAMGLDSCYQLSDATLALAVGAAALARLGFHGLVGESQFARRECVAQYGLTPCARLRRWGVLGKRTLLAGTVHLDQGELDILQRHGGWLVHTPRADMLSGVGIAPIPQYLASGVGVCLGSDGMPLDMLAEVQAAYLIQRLPGASGQALTPVQTAGLLTHANAAMASLALGQPVGTLAAGALADLIMIKPFSAAPLTDESLAGQMVLGSAGLVVDTVIVAGRVLLHHGEYQTVDADQVVANARTATADLWRRL